MALVLLPLYWKAVCAPWLIPFSPGSPLCQTAGEIDLWVKQAFLGMVIYWTGGEETWWFTDRFSHSQTHTEIQMSSLHFEGTFMRRVQGNLKNVAKLFFRSAVESVLFSSSLLFSHPTLVLWLTKELSAGTTWSGLVSRTVCQVSVIWFYHPLFHLTSFCCCQMKTCQKPFRRKKTL